MAMPTEKQHVPVFVSSTYEDMIPYRDAVQRVLIRLEQVIKGMEYFGSSPQSPLDVCLRQVRESKIFVGIIGMRYGSLNDSTGISYTQLEYEEAIKCDIPTLIYIIDENHPIAPKYVDMGEKAEKLASFKEFLKKKHTISYFTTPDVLAEKISQDIIDILSAVELVRIEESKTQREDFMSVYQKYRIRPLKYFGREGILTMKILGDLRGATLKDQLILSFGLILGDTVCVDVIVSDEKRKISLYADQRSADWLMEIPDGAVITAKVKLSYCEIKETKDYDEGTILRPSSYIGLILLDLLTIDGKPA